MPYFARSILAIDMSPFGRALQLLPTMRALRFSYPRTFLAVAAPAGVSELLKASGLADETISLGVIRFSERGHAGTIKRVWELVRRSRRFDIDLVLDFSPRLDTQMLARLVLRARTLTPSRLPRAIELVLGLGGVSSRGASAYENLLRQADVELKDTRLLITPSVDEDSRFERRLANAGSGAGELIALLYASNPEDRHGWPVASFGEIAVRLCNNFNVRIVAADEPSDDAFTDAVNGLLPQGAIKLAEPRSLELAAAIARVSIVVTDEPGIARLASELGTPVIEVAGASPEATSSSTTHRVVQSSSRARVSTDQVYDIACEMIQESRSSSLFRRQ